MRSWAWVTQLRPPACEPTTGCKADLESPEGRALPGLPAHQHWRKARVHVSWGYRGLTAEWIREPTPWPLPPNNWELGVGRTKPAGLLKFCRWSLATRFLRSSKQWTIISFTIFKALSLNGLPQYHLHMDVQTTGTHSPPQARESMLTAKDKDA